MAKGKRATRSKRKKISTVKTTGTKKNNTLMMVPVVFILIVGGFYFIGRGAEGSSGGALTIEPKQHDFGDVSVRGGVVKTSMAIENKGSSDLLINDMETSCGCTSATVEKDGVEGPVFNMKMHGNPIGWSETLKPGETALLNVYYDPTVHPDLRGPVTRSISVYSNDPKAPVKEIRIHVNQVD